MLRGLLESLKDQVAVRPDETRFAEVRTETVRAQVRALGQELAALADRLRDTGHGGPAQLIKRASNRAMEIAGPE